MCVYECVRARLEAEKNLAAKTTSIKEKINWAFRVFQEEYGEVMKKGRERWEHVATAV